MEHRKTLKKIEDRKGQKATINNSGTRATKAEAQKQYSEADKVVALGIRRISKSLGPQAGGL